MFSTTPAYNLKVVLRETGMSAHTLRVWERRYGLPKPSRTPGGHRLYSQRDIETVKWLKARQAEGLSISRAVALWKKLEAAGVDPLAGAESTAAVSEAPEAVDALREAWIASCMDFDEARAEQVLHQAFALYPVEMVCTELLQRALVEIGERWYRRQATVQQEHFASALVQRRLDALIAAAPSPTRAQTVLVACPPGELHTIPALLLTLFLRRRGFPVVYLGADVPLDRLEDVAHRASPSLAIVLAQQLRTAMRLPDIAVRLQDAGAATAYAGRIFNLNPGVREAIPAHFLGEALDRAAQEVEALVTPSKETGAPTVRPPARSELAERLERRRVAVEAHVLDGLQGGELTPEHLALALEAMGDNLIAALALGDLGLLHGELQWLRGLLANYQVRQGTLDAFLRAYAEAVEAVLGPPADEIVRWLRAQASLSS